MDSTAVLKAEAAESPVAHHEAASEPVTGKKGQEPTEPQGFFDKPLKIKGTNIQIQFGGFAKVDFMYDFYPIGNADQFKVNSIPVDGDPEAALGSSTNISAKQTRLRVFQDNTEADSRSLK
jgi:hypothetical protein